MATKKPLIDLLTAPWAILPETLAEIQRIYALHLRGETIDIAAVEANLGRPLANDQKGYDVRAGGVAVLPVSGVMAPKANMFMQISGGVSTQLLAKQFDSMAADSRVASAVIAWDSPGGNVLGVPAAAAALARLAAAKPTVSVSEGTMASAAYWVGSAANAVYIEGSTDQVGSLGVYQRLSWDEAAPNTMELVRGKYKRASRNGMAPDAEQVAYLEGQMDHLYTVLIDAVAQQRGTTSDAVLDRMADGRVFIGEQALAAGLADGMSTVDAMVEQLATNPKKFAQRRKAQFALGGLAAVEAAAAPPTTTEEETDTMSKLLTAEALAMTAVGFAAALIIERPDFAAALIADGATAERERISAVRAQALPGHEALIDRLAADGKTTGPEAAVAVLQAERELSTKRAKDIAADAPKPLPADASADPGANQPAADKPPASPLVEAQALAQAITRKQAEAAASGRPINVSQALALVQSENSHV